VIEPALEAAALANRALEADPALTAAHLVGQIRATVTDLLQAVGLDRSDAVDRVRAAQISRAGNGVSLPGSTR